MNIQNQKLYAASYITWDESLSDYPSDEYTLYMIFRKGNGTPISITATAGEDNSHTITIGTDDISDHGRYTYSAKLVNKTNEAQTFIYKVGTIDILPNIAESGTDPRSDWHILYDNLMTKYKAMIAAGQVYSEVNILGRVKKLNRTELLMEISNAAARAGIDTGYKKLKVRNV